MELRIGGFRWGVEVMLAPKLLAHERLAKDWNLKAAAYTHYKRLLQCLKRSSLSPEIRQICI